MAMFEPLPLYPRKRHSSRRHGMSQTCHNQKFATAISSSQFVQAPQTEAAKRKPASIYSGHFSSMESVEKKRAAEPLFFAFIGKDATHHRRPYTSRTPGCSTPNAGGNRKHQRRSYQRSRCLLEHCGTRHYRRESHRHRGVRRRRPGLQLLTRVTGPSLVQYQVSTFRFSIRA